MLTKSQKKLAQVWAILSIFPLVVLINSYYPRWCPYRSDSQSSESQKNQDNIERTNGSTPIGGQTEVVSSSDPSTHEYCPNPFAEPYLWFHCMARKTVTNPEPLFLSLAAAFAFMAAFYTRKLVLGADDTAKRQLRAYVGGRPSEIAHTGLVVHWTFEIENFGQTPASQLTDNALVDICPYPLPPNYPFPSLPQMAPSAAVIHPRMGKYGGTGRSQRTFTPSELTQIVDGTVQRLYIFGEIKYMDIFGKDHTTRFCHSLIGSRALFNIGSGQPIHGTLPSEPADQHNEAN
jgi:hypothetical protein